MPKKTFGEDLIAKGENPWGQTSQTSDQTIRAGRALPVQDYKWDQCADGPRWNKPSERIEGSITNPPPRDYGEQFRPAAVGRKPTK